MVSRAQKLLKIIGTMNEASGEGDVWQVEIDLTWEGFVVFSSGEEATSQNGTTLTFRYTNEEDAREAEKVAKEFSATQATRVTQTTGKGYPVFKADLFAKILADTIDPKVNQTVKAYRRGSGRGNRW